MLRTQTRDNTQARRMMGDGTYKRVMAMVEETELNSQEFFYQQAYDAAAKASSADPETK